MCGGVCMGGCACGVCVCRGVYVCSTLVRFSFFGFPFKKVGSLMTTKIGSKMQ